MTQTVLIVGGNRGIGLATVKEFASHPDTKVIATARTTTDDLDAFSLSHPGVVTVLKLDVTSKDSIAQFGKQMHEVAKDGIDMFIGNSGVGVGIWNKVFETTYDEYMHTFQVNVVGLIFAFKEVSDLLSLRQTKKALFVSSEAGFVNGPTLIRTSSYGASKAALNHVCISLSTELESEGIAVVAMTPGPVSTEMYDVYIESNLDPETSKRIPLKTTSECADYIVNTVTPKVTLENTGKFFDLYGNILPL